MLSCCLAAAALSGPNFVTPLLQSGSVADAQAASRVSLPGWSGDLYSGFFTVDAATASNTYFVFSKALSKRDDAPVLLWLNGGPGASSLLGFYEVRRQLGRVTAGSHSHRLLTILSRTARRSNPNGRVLEDGRGCHVTWISGAPRRSSVRLASRRPER